MVRSRFARACWIWLLSGPHCARLAAEQREEAGALTAHALALLGEAVELALLLAGEVFVALDLAARVGS